MLLMDLYRDTMRLLDERTESLRAIAEATGLNYEWLSKLNQRRISDPSVNLVQRLYNHLSQQRGKAA